MTPPSPIHRLNSVLEGRYRVEREVGEGGMAKVYLASDLRHARKVALKVLRPELGAAVGADRFSTEILTTAQLQHPNILQLFDSGEADGLLFYVMPYVDGPTLAERIEEERQLPVDEALEIGIAVAEALDYAHRQGVVHRDIKPGNILLHDGHPLVADFGIAQLLGNHGQQRLTRTGIAVGTATYMSPEQASGDPKIDHRSDIYSLGAVLYEMLAGQPPHTGSTPMAVLTQVLTKSPEPLSQIRPRVGPVDAVVTTALARLPADRFTSAAHMSAELKKTLDMSLGLRPVPAEARAPGRKTGPALRSGIAVGVMLAVLATLVWGASRWAPQLGFASSKSVALAVLPFRSLGAGAEDLAAGITLTTRDRLAALPGFNLIGAATSGLVSLEGLPASEIATEVGADYVLRASVERDVANGRVSVRPELYGRTGTRIDFWAEPIVVPISSLSSLEGAIAEDVASALDITLGRAARSRLTPPDRNPAAYEALLRAVAAVGPARDARFREVIALDSTLSVAHAALGNSLLAAWSRNPQSADSAMFHRHASAAIRHGPEDFGGYLWMGVFHRSVTLNADSATYYLDRARELAPGQSAVAHFRATGFWLRGQMESALVEAERAAALDPLHPAPASLIARIHLWQGNLGEAKRRHEETLPQALRVGSTFTIANGILIELASGDLDAAVAQLSTIEPLELRLRTAEFVLNQAPSAWVFDDALFEALCRSQPSHEPGPWQPSLAERQVACALEEGRRGNRAEAEAVARAVRGDLLVAVANRPDYDRSRMSLAFVELILGDTVGALVNADAAYAANSAFWDFYPGAMNGLRYVRLLAMAGDTARLLPTLSSMLEGPSIITKAWVGIDPAFDGVRNQPGVADLIR